MVFILSQVINSRTYHLSPINITSEFVSGFSLFSHPVGFLKDLILNSDYVELTTADTNLRIVGCKEIRILDFA
jgi:hypothetical protein